MIRKSNSDAAIRELLIARTGVQPSKSTLRFIISLLSSPDFSQVDLRSVTSHYSGLRRALTDYLEWQCCLNEKYRDETRLAGQESWSETSLAKKQRMTVARTIKNVMSTAKTVFSEADTLVDLGCGDGQAACAFLRAILPFSKIHEVLLVDQSAEAVRDASKTVHECLAENIVIRSMQCDVRYPKLWANVKGRNVVVLASGCLHEVPSVSKLAILRRIRRFANVFVLVELLSDHDKPRSGSSLLMQQAAKFYEDLISDAYCSIDDDAKREKIIGGFLLAEFLDVLTMPYSARRNYHMTQDEWEAILLKTGFKLLAQERTSMVKDGLEGVCTLAVVQ